MHKMASNYQTESSTIGFDRKTKMLAMDMLLTNLDIYGTVHEKMSFRIYIYIQCYNNASLLNRYIFRTVNAINFLFSTLHTTPFPYGKIYFGVLQLLRASIATFDTPPGSNPP